MCLSFRKAVISIISSSQWKDAMRSCMTTGKNNLVATQVLDTPLRMLIRKYPDLAETVLDHCYKEKKLDTSLCVEMNFEFIEDTFNYQPKQAQQIEINWYDMFLSKNNSGYEHFTKAMNSSSNDEGFENPYTNDHEFIIRNHPMMVMAEHSRGVRIFFILDCIFNY